MDLTPQQTQIHGVNGTMDLITSTGSKSDHGFDPTTDKSTEYRVLMGPWILSQVQGVNGIIDLTPQQTQIQGVN